MKKQILTFSFFCFFLFPLNSQTVWTLEDCIRFALSHHYQIQHSQINSSIAKTQERIVKNSRLPYISSDLDQFVSFGQSPSHNGLYLDDNSYSMNLNLDFSMPLFSSMEFYWQNRTARQECLAADYQTETIKYDMVFNIISLYLQCVCQKEINAYTEQLFIHTEEQCVKMETLFALGKVSEKEMLECRSQLSAVKVEMISAKYQFELLLLQLCQQINKQDSVPIDIPFIADIQNCYLEIKPSLETIFEYASQHDPAVLTAKAQLAKYGCLLQQQQSAALPKLQLVANYCNGYYAYPTIGNDLLWQQMKHNGRFSIGLGLCVPIMNRKETSCALQELKFKQNQAAINLKQTETQLWFSIKQCYLKYESAKEKFLACDTNYRTALKVYEHVTACYEMKKITIFEYHNCQMQTFHANVERLKAFGEYLFYGKMLDLYEGKVL